MADRICCTICGVPQIARGWCTKHYQRWRIHGDPNYEPQPSRVRAAGSKPTRFAAIGQRFGRWVVTGPETRTPNGRRGVPVRCSCLRSPERVMGFADLYSGKSNSCGCLRNEMTAQRNRENLTHGLAKHPLMETRRGMLRRCEDRADKSWPDYGGRGISVCAAWHDPADFIAWVDEHLGPRPDGMSFDRINNDGNYEPGNVRWATALQQRHNRRPLRHCACGNDNPAKAMFCFKCGSALVVAARILPGFPMEATCARRS